MNFLQTGLLDYSIWGLVIATLVLTHITIASVTIFLHRHQAHRALELHPIVSHFFRFWLWLTTGMVTKQWVAVHRKHHAGCETVEDPHSPQVYGLRKVFLQGAELYKDACRNEQILEKYGQGTPDDFVERHLYSRFQFLGISLMAIIDVMLFGVIGITIFAIQMIWIPLWAAGVINGIGHYWGYRSFETVDASRNVSPIGILIGGEEFHNNHHAHASSAKLANKWWEFDIGWFYIKLMSFVRLATVRKVAPTVKSEPGKSVVDIDTVRAVVMHRFHILKLYGNDVIKPVIRVERRKANAYFRKLMKRSRRLMVREDIKIDHKSHVLLSELLAHNHTLETVYRFKQQLKELWARTSANHALRVSRLQEWCTQAEQTGIEVLYDFAQSLRRYSLQPAYAV